MEGGKRARSCYIEVNNGVMRPSLIKKEGKARRCSHGALVDQMARYDLGNLPPKKHTMSGLAPFQLARLKQTATPRRTSKLEGCKAEAPGSQE